MNNNLQLGLMATIAAILFLAALMFGIRQVSLAITTVDVFEAEPGVRCARMVTADAVALSCWSVK